MKRFSMIKIVESGTSTIYRLKNSGTTNEYYVASSPEAMELIVNPETVGYTCQRCLLQSTQTVMQFLREKEHISRPHIFNILRGGLNFPLEEACFNISMKVCSTDFVSCERVIENGVIKGLDIRYEKLIVEKDVTLLIGDIIASGETLLECIPLIAKRYKDLGGNIRKIIFFTIGGTKSVTLMEKLTIELKKIWSDFEGFRCIFYEGMFTVYEDNGITGVNTPDIDFGWKGGAVSPELRKRMMNQPLSLFEKCIIYDGGARRYEIHNHIDEVCEYWKELRKVADNVEFKLFLEEKIGYPLGITYEEWLVVTHLVDTCDNRQLWEKEQMVLRNVLKDHTLKSICEKRLNEFTDSMNEYKD